MKFKLTESIYDELNKIDDNKSLDDSYQDGKLNKKVINNTKDKQVKESAKLSDEELSTRKNDVKTSKKSKPFLEYYADYDQWANDWAGDVINTDEEDEWLISSLTDRLVDEANVPVACEYSSWNDYEFVSRMLNNETFTIPNYDENTDEAEDIMDLIIEKISAAYKSWLKLPETILRGKKAMENPEFSLAQDWYNDSGDAGNDNWPEEMLGSDPDYLERVNHWWEDNRWKYMDEEDFDESLNKKLEEDAETSNAIVRGIDKVIKDTTAVFEEASPIMEGGLVEYFDKYKQYLEQSDADEVKNALNEFIQYINVKFIDRINFFKNQLEK